MSDKEARACLLHGGQMAGKSLTMYVPFSLTVSTNRFQSHTGTGAHGSSNLLLTVTDASQEPLSMRPCQSQLHAAWASFSSMVSAAGNVSGFRLGQFRMTEGPKG